MEIFKQIKEYPLYSVSNLGRIRKNSNRKILAPSRKPNGYMQVNLFTGDGRRKKEYVHRLVALTFIPNTHHAPEVNHIDAVRDNNHVSNLEWVTRAENVAKSSVVKRLVVVDKDGHSVVYASIGQACEELGLTDTNVSACLGGRQKTHRGYSFRLEQS